MSNIPNGAGQPPPFMLPPAPGDGIFDSPPAPGAAPPMFPLPTQPPPEHRATVGAEAVPETVEYQGGGIFAAATTGPSFENAAGQGASPMDAPGLDFGPGVMTDGLSPIPMAAPGMPDIGPPPTHGGVLGPLPPMGHVGQGAPIRNGHMLGLSLIALASGAAVGAKYGGLYGAIAGSLFAGAGVNALRALTAFKEGTPDADKEGAVSGTYAVASTAIAGVIWAKLVQPGEEMTPNKKRRRRRKVAEPNPCDIRPVL